VYQNFLSYLSEAQHVSGDTPPIIRSLKLHWQPMVLHTWRVDGRVVSGRCCILLDFLCESYLSFGLNISGQTIVGLIFMNFYMNSVEVSV
jgi:hypothetical protein